MIIIQEETVVFESNANHIGSHPGYLCPAAHAQFVWFRLRVAAPSSLSLYLRNMTPQAVQKEMTGLTETFLYIGIYCPNCIS